MNFITSDNFWPNCVRDCSVHSKCDQTLDSILQSVTKRIVSFSIFLKDKLVFFMKNLFYLRTIVYENIYFLKYLFSKVMPYFCQLGIMHIHNL